MKSYPATTLLSLLIGLGFVGNLIGLSPLLAFSGLESLIRPWTILTYPFALLSPSGFAFLSALFSIVTLYFIGRALENRWGSLGWACFFVVTTLAAALWSFVIGISGWGLLTLSEPWIVLGGAMMLWAWENPELPLLAYGVFPMKAIYFALIFVAFEFFQLLSFGFLLACTALIPVGVAWLWLMFPRRRGGGRSFYKREVKKRSYLRRVK